MKVLALLSRGQTVQKRPPVHRSQATGNGVCYVFRESPNNTFTIFRIALRQLEGQSLCLRTCMCSIVGWWLVCLGPVLPFCRILFCMRLKRQLTERGIAGDNATWVWWVLDTESNIFHIRDEIDEDHCHAETCPVCPEAWHCQGSYYCLLRHSFLQATCFGKLSLLYCLWSFWLCCSSL